MGATRRPATVSCADAPDDEPSTARRDAATTALAQIKAMEVEAQLNVRSATDKAESVRGKGDSLRRQAAHERLAKARHDKAIARRRTQAEIAKVVATSVEDLMVRTSDAITRATADRDHKIADRNQLQTQLGQAKDLVSDLRSKLGQLNDNAHSSEIARSQAQVRLEEAQQSLVEKLGIPVADIIRDYSPAEDFNYTEEANRLKQAEKDLAALGKVNPLALEEYRALEERYEFLATQLADVEQARRDLSDVIEDVDRKILQLFTDAWHDVEVRPRMGSHTGVVQNNV